MNMLNPVQNIDLEIVHVFAIELDARKRSLLMAEHPECKHVFSDVTCMRDESGWCYKCNENHKISQDTMGIDMYLCGPSCKDLSLLKQKDMRSQEADSYEKPESEQTGTSGFTYHFGFKRVTRLKQVAFYLPERLANG